MLTIEDQAAIPSLPTMAASIPAVISTAILSHKQRRAALRKERRKRKRKALAQARDSELKDGAEEDKDVNDGDTEDSGAAEEASLQLHKEWLERERLAQEEFKLRFEKEDAARKRKEEEERLIREEWESQQRREQEEKEQRQQAKRDREEAGQKMLDQAENQLDNKGPWMNPEAPVPVNSENIGTERDIANCPFFLKTGACRFGDRCSRKHVYPEASPTLMVRGMFRTFGMEELRRDDYDMDACLEHSEEELHESFLDFYHDVLPEFKSVGKVVQFKVCCNYEPHLKGNVYIQFENEEHCKEAFIKFNGRWYAGRQLHCEICPVTRWKNAICGLFDKQKCPKGKHCNFLHVFRNPGNDFWEADRDLHLSPDRSVRGSHREGWHSERHRERSWRQRLYSRSPERRSERSHSRREDDRRRSRSRERRAFHQQRSSRSRHSESRTDRHQSPSRDRSRSRGKDGERSGRRNNDREPKYRHRSEERVSRDEDEDTHGEIREKKRRKQSKEKSPKNSDEMKDGKTQRRHKHSKKAKKSKKKRKKKSHTPDVTTSSEESEKEKESEEEAVDDPLAQSPSGDTNNTKTTQEKCVHETNLSSDVKSELATSEIQSEPTGNPDNGFS